MVTAIGSEEEELEEDMTDHLLQQLGGTFFQPPGSDDEIPPFRRLFARIDQIEPHLPGEDTRLVSFDCINADFLEEISFDIQPLHMSPDTNVDRNLAIVKAEFSKARAKELQKSGWVFLEIAHDSDAFNALYSKTLFDEPSDVQIKETTMEELSSKSDENFGFRFIDPLMFKRELDRIAGWEGIQKSQKKVLNSIVRKVPEIDGAVVYDVGQGSCIALLNNNDTVAFFDVGCSVMGNIRSFPDVKASICTSGTKVIFLSHWDWDHWSFALRGTSLTNAHWVVPIQKKSGPLGLVHARFVAALRKANVKIHWVGSKFGSRNYSNGISLTKSNYNKKNRNKSGLIIGVQKTAEGHKLLLPGDGVLEELKPTDKTWKADFIVAPHHGGKTILKHHPLPERVTRSTIIYSYGTGNIFLHPMAATLRFWRTTKWKKNAHTAIRASDGLGSVGIDLTKMRSHHACGCSCTFCPTNVRRWLS